MKKKHIIRLLLVLFLIGISYNIHANIKQEFILHDAEIQEVLDELEVEEISNNYFTNHHSNKVYGGDDGGKNVASNNNIEEVIITSYINLPKLTKGYEYTNIALKIPLFILYCSLKLNF